MSHSSTHTPNPPLQRKKIFFLRGFQLRYVCLVGGSLFVLLVFSGLHGLFVIKNVPLADSTFQIRAMLQESTWRLFLVGSLYIVVMTLAAMFLSHRAVGPLARLEDELRELSDDSSDRYLKVREGDELENLVGEINKVLKTRRESKK